MLNFTKMHGLGNDFIVIDGINQKIDLKPEHIAALAERHTGIGFDQLLIIEPSLNKNIDFNYRIFNANGQEVGQCGNGARCLALFAKHYKLTNKTELRVATKTTAMKLSINSDNTVSVDMGIPKLNPKDIPLTIKQEAKEYNLELQQEKTTIIHALSVGNPHAVLLVNDLETAPVNTLGQEICLHPIFPEQTNVDFMQIINPKHIKLRVYERGCGETRACGSGAVAAAAIGQLYYNLEKKVRVSLPGGDLIVEWSDFKQSIILTGPAMFVYEGRMC